MDADGFSAGGSEWYDVNDDYCHQRRRVAFEYESVGRRITTVATKRRFLWDERRHLADRRPHWLVWSIHNLYWRFSFRAERCYHAWPNLNAGNNSYWSRDIALLVEGVFRAGLRLVDL